MVLSQSLHYLWQIFLAALEATEQRPRSHKSEYLLHVNGLYFYTNTASRVLWYYHRACVTCGEFSSQPWRLLRTTQQRPSSHKSEYLLHVNGLYFYTNTAFRPHQASESDTETTSFWNRFRVVYGRIHTNPDWKICGVKNLRIPVVEARGRGGHLGIFWVGMCRPGLQIGTPF